MLAKLKRKSDRARDALRHMFRSPSPEPPAAVLEYTSWDGLQTLVRLLSDNPGHLSLLTSTIGRLSACVEMFDARARTRPEYSQLGMDMDELFSRLANDSTLYASHERIAPFAQRLEYEIQPLVKSEERNIGAEDDMTTNDLNKVLRHYRRIRTLFAVFLMSESPATWKLENDEELATQLDSLPHVPQASYLYAGPDAISRNGCMPQTRTDVLEDLYEWVHYGRSQKIRWLNGTTGAGKTAVAYSLCDYLESRGKPFASFFGSQQVSACRDVKRVLPSVSYQLARQSLPFRCAVSRELSQNIDVLRTSVTEQFAKLIAAPLSKVGHTFSNDPVVVIDGIDECDDKDEIYRLLRVLVEQAPILPLKILISILPSRMTYKYMRGTPGERHQFELRLHEFDRTVARADIRTYLAAKLENLALSTTELERLAHRSGASFLYATAMVQYLGKAGSSEHAERLQQLLAASDPADLSYHDPDVRYSFLTEAILHGEALEDSTRCNLLTLLRTHAQEEAPPSLVITASLLGLRFDVGTQTMLQLLLPVLCASGSDGLTLSLEKPFATYFLSRLHSDTWLDQDLGQPHAQLARGCFDMIQSMEPSFNFCDLESSCLLDREVSYLTERASDTISPGLLYACLRWETHMELADMAEDLYTRLEEFLSTRLLLWMEILNLKKCLPIGVTLLSSLHKTLQRSTCSKSMTRLVEDACEFVSIFSNSPISQSTPQIYVSTLQFWSRTGPILECYRPRLRSLVNATEEWPTKQAQSFITSDHAVQAARGTDIDDSSSLDRLLQDDVAQPPDGHTSSVLSVAYSPDGAYIASGSSDNTIRVGDAHIGEPVGQPLTGHTSWVRSVAYSPDGAYIASGSFDETIRIWDARTGKSVDQPLTGHTGLVLSVAYSPDGAYIASGSGDTTIRIWDARTGKPVGQPLTGHTDLVKSVAYSPDGAYIASGSADRTIRIWDARTGKPAGQPLTGHTGRVLSVAYSPDGAYIASGSDDKTIRIWDARIGKPVGQPLTGHTYWVFSVAYSPDGSYIASGSGDNTIRIWDAHTGKPVGQPLTGHTGSVRSVAYSPDGAYLVSGSWDNTIRIWFAPTWPEPKPVQPSTPSQRTAIEPFRRPFWTVLKSTNQTTRRSRPNHTYKGDNKLKQQAVAVPPITASPLDWTLNEDGWVVGPSQERLIWVPPDLRDKVAHPRIKAIIPTGPSIVFDFRKAKLGLDWQDCYNPS